MGAMNLLNSSYVDSHTHPVSNNLNAPIAGGIPGNVLIAIMICWCGSFCWLAFFCLRKVLPVDALDRILETELRGSAPSGNISGESEYAEFESDSEDVRSGSLPGRRSRGGGGTRLEPEKEAKVTTIVSMGFTRQRAIFALVRNVWDESRAIDMLV